MTFTAKAFIVCDLGRRGTDLSWLTVMPFNTVINPDPLTGTMNQGPPLASLPSSFASLLLPSTAACSSSSAAGGNSDLGSSHSNDDGPEHVTQTRVGCEVPRLWGNGGMPKGPAQGTRAAPQVLAPVLARLVSSWQNVVERGSGDCGWEAKSHQLL